MSDTLMEPLQPLLDALYAGYALNGSVQKSADRFEMALKTASFFLGAAIGAHQCAYPNATYEQSAAELLQIMQRVGASCAEHLRQHRALAAAPARGSA